MHIAETVENGYIADSTAYVLAAAAAAEAGDAVSLGLISRVIFSAAVGDIAPVHLGGIHPPPVAAIMEEKAACIASCVMTGMTQPSVALAVDKRTLSNVNGSPARLVTHPGSPGKHNEVMSPPSVTEKKSQTNGHFSPLRLPGNNNNNHADVEGYLKTDDRMRLAKERREEREKGLAVREQAIRDKDQRARLQYERTVEERWRRLEEQRQKEELRRTAVEEKRRLRLEEEKERLEALMKRSLERSLQLEQRSKRWVWGGPAGAQGDCENAPLPLSAASAFPHDLAAPLPAASESAQHCHLNSLENLRVRLHRLLTPTHSSMARCHSAADLHVPCHRCTAPCSPHRSPYRGSPSRADRRRPNGGVLGSAEMSGGGSFSTPNTPKKERLRRERRTASPAIGSPVRRAESPAMLTRRSVSPATPKLMLKSRAQSPCTGRQYYASPTRHRPNTPVADDNKKGEDSSEEAKNQDTGDKNVLVADTQSPVKSPGKKLSNTETPEKRHPKTESPGKTAKGETSEMKDSPDKKSPAAETPEKKMPQSTSSDLNVDKSTEPSPVTPTGKAVAGTTNAEEASRLLAERRRQARVQKELEEKQRREREEEDRLKAEQLKRRHAEGRARQEEEARRAEEEKSRQEDLRKRKEEEEKLQREGQEKELQAQVDREREEAELQAQKETEHQRQEREIQKLQEDEERHLRKKRIEEIMKRTRKSEAEMKKEEGQVETVPQLVSPSGEVQTNSQTKAQVNVQENPKVESQDDGEAAVQGDKQDGAPAKAQVTTQLNNQGSGEANGKVTDQVILPPKNGCEKGPEAEPISEQTGAQVNGQGSGSAQVLKQESALAKGQVVPRGNEQESAAQVNVKATDQMNQLENTKRLDSTQENKQEIAQIIGQVKKQEGSQMNVKLSTQTVEGGVTGGTAREPNKPSTAPLPVNRQSPPLINLEPLDVKSSGVYDEVQSMEVSPVSKEELISIPEFSPVTEQHNVITNSRALEDLLDLTGHVAYPKLSPMGNLGDCNKNLIDGVCSPSGDSKLIQTLHPPSHKLNIK